MNKNKKQIKKINNIKTIFMGYYFYSLYFTDNHTIHNLICKDILLLKH